MTLPLNILFVEDNLADFMLLEHFLHQQGMVARCHRVSSHTELDAALQQEWDVVLTDYHLPRMDFVSVVRRVKARLPDVPIILVSGSLEEGAAAEMLHLGLRDFILKAHLIRLPAAIERAIHEVAEHRARRAAEIQLLETQAIALEAQRQASLAALNLMEDAVAARERAEAAQLALQSSSKKYRLLSENAADWIFWLGTDGQFKYISPACEHITAYAPAAFLADADLLLRIIHPDDKATYQAHLRDNTLRDEGELVYRIFDKKGVMHWISHHCQLMFDEQGNCLGRHGTNRDITTRKATEAQRDLFSEALRQSAQPLLLIDQVFNITYVNPAFSELFGYTQAELLGKAIGTLRLHPVKGQANATDIIADVMQSGAWSGELECIAKDDTVIPVASVVGVIRDANEQKIVGFVGSYLDLRPLREKEILLRKLSMAVEQSPESIEITDLHANIEYVNEAFARVSGYTREELLGSNPSKLRSGKTPVKTFENLWQAITRGEIWQGEFCNRSKDGREYIEHAIISPIRQANGKITHYVAIKEDITDKKRTEAEIHRLAFYDPLTGLPNRALLLERIANSLAFTQHNDHYSALISLNIDRFKTINDAAGQAIGDRLLKAIGERLERLMRENDVVARIAGDEFGILLHDLAPQPATASRIVLENIEKIHANLQQPFSLNEENISLTACLGVTIIPCDLQDTPLDVLRRANTALHHSKTKGTGQSTFFDDDLDALAKHRFSVERELHQGILNQELRMYLQSQVDAHGVPVGAEALVRWQHPQRGLVSPAAFIPIAEESNLIIEIGLWMLNAVCTLLVQPDMVAHPFRISVNISPRHFRQADFVDQIKQEIARTGANPTHLTLEITEGMVIDNINDVIAKMNELSAMGIHFSMDDFGTGYSSLSYLKRLPIHELKIDQSFVQDITNDANDAALVETILAVAKHLRLKVIAEGVETQAQADFLNQHGTVIHQGYLFSIPEPVECWRVSIQSAF